MNERFESGPVANQERLQVKEANAAVIVIGIGGIAGAAVCLRNQRQAWLNTNIPYWIDHTNPAADGHLQVETCTSSWGRHSASTWAGENQIKTSRNDWRYARTTDAELPNVHIVGDFSHPGQVISTRTLPNGESELRFTELDLKPVPFLGIKELGSEQLSGWSTSVIRNGQLVENRVARFTVNQTEATHGKIVEKVFESGKREPVRSFDVDFRTNGLPGSRDRFCVYPTAKR